MPAWPGALKLNDSTACGPDVHGETLHSELAESSAFGEATGTNTCRDGMAKVWPTVQPAQPLNTETRRVGVATPLALTMLRFMVPPIVPWTRLQKLFRGGVQPLLGGRVLDEVTHPVRLAGRVVLRILLQHHVGHPAGGVEGDRWRAAEQVMDDDECRTDDHCRERDEQGRDTDRQRHQSPPRFFARTGARDWAGLGCPPGPRPEACYEPDLPSIRARRQHHGGSMTKLS